MINIGHRPYIIKYEIRLFFLIIYRVGLLF